jgi:hypothetical protein
MECEQTRSVFVDASDACKQAVDAGLSCMAEQPCGSWANASLAEGACGAALVQQDELCGDPAYFAGWDACVSTCTHAVTECHVDVPELSTWMSYENCRSECLLNKEFDASAGCLEESLAYAACQITLDCRTLQNHLQGVPGAAPRCDALATAWADACAF